MGPTPMGFFTHLKSLYKLNPLLLKLLVSSLALIITFGLIFHRSTDFPPEDNFTLKIIAPQTSLLLPPPPPVLVDAPADAESSKSDKCNLFYGEWIPNPSGPAYTNETCNLIESHQNCMMNGRPDTGYLYWKWSPKNCNLPDFDPKRFLETIRNKRWGLIGDSIARNHVQSLLCILSTVEQAEMIYHDEAWRSKTWLFPSYNATILVIWAPFLAEAALYDDIITGASNSDIEVQVDKLDKTWYDQFHTLDYVILSSGKWYLKPAVYYENDTVIGCHYCSREKNITDMGFDVAYRKVLRLVLEFLSSSNHKGMIFFRTSTPDHFEGGDWYEGGRCNRTSPHRVGEVQVKDLQMSLRRAELEEFEKVEAVAKRNGVNLKLLDVLPLSLLRPDGHPDVYRYYYPFAKNKTAEVVSDCLHWCLPGPIDAWNDVIMEMVMSDR